MTLKEKLFLEKARLAKKQNAQYAAEVLAAQMPRLELYSTMNVSSFACKALPQQVPATRVTYLWTRYFTTRPARFLLPPPGTTWHWLVQEEHETSMQKIAAAVAAALQQMPLVNGAICGASAEVYPASCFGRAFGIAWDAESKYHRLSCGIAECGCSSAVHSPEEHPECDERLGAQDATVHQQPGQQGK